MNMQCVKCGGKIRSVGEGKYKCPYCREEYVETVKTAQTQNVRDEGADVFARNINGVAEISCTFGNSGCCGSGFLINENGFLLTNSHVVTNENGKAADRITVKLAGSNVDARIVAVGDTAGGYGNGIDLALLYLPKIPAKAVTLTMGDFSQVRIGEQAYVIGNSKGFGTCITSGIISDKTRNVGGKRLMMTDCAVNGGNSGGPIFNANGEVIGVIVSKFENVEGMNFAIPADDAIEFVEEVQRTVRAKINGK